MTKRELIEEITGRNPTAKPAFLAEFDDGDLAEYLQHLQWLDQPRGTRLTEDAGESGAGGDVGSAPQEPAASKGRHAQRPGRGLAQQPQPVGVAASAEKNASPFAPDSSQEDAGA